MRKIPSLGLMFVWCLTISGMADVVAEPLRRFGLGELAELPRENGCDKNETRVEGGMTNDGAGKQRRVRY